MGISSRPSGYDASTKMENVAANHDNKVSISIEDIVSSISQKRNRPDLRTPRDWVDKILTERGMGKTLTVRDKTFNGFNHRHARVNLPPAANHNGYCFFVRPNLNLSDPNCIRVRQLAKLITNNQMSFQQWARLTLDPRLHIFEGLDSPLIDNENAFIPLLSNNLKSLTNVPSLVAGTMSTDRGINKEVFSMIDDNVFNYEAYTISTSFINTNGNPFLILFYPWILAASMQYLGRIVPYFDDLMQRRLNYTSRIYRLVMDHTKTFVTNIWAPISCFPISIETGSIFKYDIEQPINQDMSTLDVQFQCNGSIFNDDLLILQFNQTVANGCRSMLDSTRNKEMVRVPDYALSIFNFYGYPRINPTSMKLEWWVKRETYETASIYLEDRLSGGASDLPAPVNKPEPEAELPQTSSNKLTMPAGKGYSSIGQHKYVGPGLMPKTSLDAINEGLERYGNALRNGGVVYKRPGE